MSRSECADVRELLDSYLSNELLVETNHRVIAHLSACPRCTEELVRRRQLREALREMLPPGPDAGAVERRILAGLSRDTTRVPWLPLLRFSWIAAACVALAVPLGWWVRESWTGGSAGAGTSTGRLLPVAYRDSIDNHVECALAQPPTLRLDPDRLAVRFDTAYRGVLKAVVESAAPYELADAHDCRHHASHFRHLILRGEGHTISVMALRTSSLPPPPAGAKKLDTGGEPPMWQFRDGPYDAATVESAGHLGVLVSDLGDGAHARLALRVLPSMARALEAVQTR